jgi:hypothetical protein
MPASRAWIFVSLLALGGCDWIFGRALSAKIEGGLGTAVERGVSPFRWSDVLPEGVTEICFFGPYDDGDGLDLSTHHDTDWALVAFDGNKEVARILGSDSEFALIKLNERGCYGRDGRITIVDRATRALRFDDRKDYRPRRK